MKRLAAILLLAGCLAPVHGQAQLGTYRVGPGEGLDAVARRHNTDPDTLKRLNQLSSDTLAQGQVLLVPSDSASTAVAPKLEPAPKLAPPLEPAAKAIRRPAPRPAVKPRRATKPVVKPVPKPVVKTVVKSAAKTAPARHAAAKPAPKPYLQDYQDPKKADGDMPVGRLILDLAWKLLVVLGVAYGSIWLLRGLMNKPGTLPGRKGHLKVLESASLGPNRSIHLVKVGGKVLVLASTNDQISALGEVDDEQTLEELNRETPRTFAEHLAGAGDGSAPDVAAEVRGGVRHLWDQVQEIRGLRPRGGRK